MRSGRNGKYMERRSARKEIEEEGKAGRQWRLQ